MARKGRSVDGFFGAPGNGILLVEVLPADGSVYAGGLWYRTGSVPDEYVPDRDLVPGPWRARLAPGAVHVLELEVRFLAQAQTKVVATLKAPSGSAEIDAIEWNWKAASGRRNLKLYVITKA